MRNSWQQQKTGSLLLALFMHRISQAMCACCQQAVAFYGRRQGNRATSGAASYLHLAKILKKWISITVHSLGLKPHWAAICNYSSAGLLFCFAAIWGGGGRRWYKWILSPQGSERKWDVSEAHLRPRAGGLPGEVCSC